jgi:hypothetical protein
MLNGLLWTPHIRKKRAGLRQANAKITALTELSATPQSWALPFWNSRTPRRVRMRLRASFLSFSKRPPLVNAVFSSLLPSAGFHRTKGVLSYEAPSANKGRVPPLSSPLYLRVNKGSKPTRAVLRLFYMYVSNPTPTVITSTKALALWNLAHCGGLVKGPFGSI